MDCMTALSLLNNEVSYLNFISAEDFMAGKRNSTESFGVAYLK
jgi:hypothetical protein